MLDDSLRTSVLEAHPVDDLEAPGRCQEGAERSAQGGFIRSLPLFPTIKRKDNPRPYFTLDEHQKLLETAADLATRDLKVRGVPLTREIWNFSHST